MTNANIREMLVIIVIIAVRAILAIVVTIAKTELSSSNEGNNTGLEGLGRPLSSKQVQVQTSASLPNASPNVSVEALHHGGLDALLKHRTGPDLSTQSAAQKGAEILRDFHG